MRGTASSRPAPAQVCSVYTATWTLLRYMYCYRVNSSLLCLERRRMAISECRCVHSYTAICHSRHKSAVLPLQALAAASTPTPPFVALRTRVQSSPCIRCSEHSGPVNTKVILELEARIGTTGQDFQGQAAASQAFPPCPSLAAALAQAPRRTCTTRACGRGRSLSCPPPDTMSPGAAPRLQCKLYLPPRESPFFFSHRTPSCVLKALLYCPPASTTSPGAAPQPQSDWYLPPWDSPLCCARNTILCIT